MTLRFSSQLLGGGGVQQIRDHLVRQVAPKGLANEPVAQLDLRGEPLQLVLDSLAVGDVRPGPDEFRRMA